jgi:hypothetical protein
MAHSSTVLSLIVETFVNLVICASGLGVAESVVLPRLKASIGKQRVAGHSSQS